MPIDLESIVREILDDIGAGRIREVLARAAPDGMSEECFYDVLRACQVTPVAPPEGSDLQLEVYRNETSAQDAWAIDVPIWTQEEGRSDLTLKLWIEFDGLSYRVTLLSLRVL
jgi:hypothetical protein